MENIPEFENLALNRLLELIDRDLSLLKKVVDSGHNLVPYANEHPDDPEIQEFMRLARNAHLQIELLSEKRKVLVAKYSR